MKQIINTKKQTLAEMEKAKTRLDKLKNLLLEQQEKRDNLKAQVEFLAEDTISKINQLRELATEKNQIELLLEQCQASINNMLGKISDIDEIINEHATEIKTIETRTADHEQQKREFEFYEKCFQEGNYNKLIKDLDKECPICFEEMLPPNKIFQCFQGHLLCENCFRKISSSTKICPYCKRDVLTTPVRNRALEESIENKSRKDMAASS